MASRRSFKSDENFLEKISIGAVGTQQVYTSLVSQGHQPIELERGSMRREIPNDLIRIVRGREIERKLQVRL